MQKDLAGFTLVELAVSLVIIGLVAGGILLGSTLIGGAENRKLVSQLTEYDTAISTFRMKYGCLPGDCANASELFDGMADGNGNTRLQADITIPDPYEGGSMDQIFGDEYAYVWEHLGASGLIAGNYNGSAIKGAGFPVTSSGEGIIIAQNDIYSEFMKVTGSNALIEHHLMVGTQADLSGVALYQGIKFAYPEATAYSIDSKYDDGLPDRGKIVSYIFRSAENEYIVAEETGYPTEYRPVQQPTILSGGQASIHYNLDSME